MVLIKQDWKKKFKEFFISKGLVESGNNIIGNIYFTTSNQSGVSNTIVRSTSFYRGDSVFYLDASATDTSKYTDFKWVIPSSEFTYGDKFTFSFYAYGTAGKEIRTYFYGASGYISVRRVRSNSTVQNDMDMGSFGDGATRFTLSSDWQKFYVTYELDTTATTPTAEKYLIIRTYGGTTINVACAKLERGEIATDYEPQQIVSKFIPPNSNLNNYTKTGFYYNGSNNNAESITPLPESGKAFWLMVEDWNGSNYTKQTLTHYNSNSTYTRTRNGGTWKLWSKVANNIEYIEGTHGTTATNVWTGTSKTIDELREGTIIYYKMSSAGISSTTSTLNLTLENGIGGTTTTGAKTIYYNGTSGLTTHFPVNSVLCLVYDGSAWRVTAIQNTNNFERLYNVYNILAGEKLTKNSLIYCSITDGKYYMLKANGSVDITKPILWTGVEIASGSGSANVYHAYHSVNIQTTVSGKTVDTNKPVYLEFSSIDSDGGFVISDNVFKTSNLSSGNYYLLLGASSSTTNLRFNNFHNDIFIYDSIDEEDTTLHKLDTEWNRIVNKPTTFTPSSHNHNTWSKIPTNYGNMYVNTAIKTVYFSTTNSISVGTSDTTLFNLSNDSKTSPYLPKIGITGSCANPKISFYIKTTGACVVKGTESLDSTTVTFGTSWIY